MESKEPPCCDLGSDGLLGMEITVASSNYRPNYIEFNCADYYIQPSIPLDNIIRQCGCNLRRSASQVGKISRPFYDNLSLAI
jgi:hypothetical protein